MIRCNKLKMKFKNGETALGTWSMLSAPSVMNVIASVGLDFVIIDMEHGPMSLETMEQQLYATEVAGCTPIVRLGNIDELNILKVLETGAQAILISHVTTVEDAEKVVQAAKYPPEGQRGLSPFTRQHGYSEQDLAQKIKRTNQELFVGVLVEGEDGLKNLDQICKVPGLDMVYLGIYDLSLTLGIPGQLEHPKMLQLLRESVQIIKKNNLVAGSVARDPNYLKMLYTEGFQFISYRVDCAILKDGYETIKKHYNCLVSETV